jgi:F0F1-type ATP synthase assembly protein I
MSTRVLSLAAKKNKKKLCFVVRSRNLIFCVCLFVPQLVFRSTVSALLGSMSQAMAKLSGKVALITGYTFINSLI